MKTILVNLKMARALRGFGFNWECEDVYLNDKPLIRPISALRNPSMQIDHNRCYLAPSLDTTIDWLLETHEIDIIINRNRRSKLRKYYFEIFTNNPNTLIYRDIGESSNKNFIKGNAIEWVLDYLTNSSSPLSTGTHSIVR